MNSGKKGSSLQLVAEKGKSQIQASEEEKKRKEEELFNSMKTTFNLGRTEEQNAAKGEADKELPHLQAQILSQYLKDEEQDSDEDLDV